MNNPEEGAIIDLVDFCSKYANYTKPKTIKLVFVPSPPRKQQKVVSADNPEKLAA